MHALLEARLVPWSIPPAATARNRAGRLVALDIDRFQRALDRGLLPVSFGDVVTDDDWGFSILSADTIAVELVAKLGARRVIFVSDVPGVLASVPSGRPRVAPEATPELLDQLRPTAGHPDVTGGIRGKVRAMIAIRELGADAGLISGLSDGALSRAIRGENVYGTWAQGAPR
jgi:isopentenyl phosphate kinase